MLTEEPLEEDSVEKPTSSSEVGVDVLVKHFGNSFHSGFAVVLIELQTGLKFSVLWEHDGPPPTQKWWNKTDEEWIPLSSLFNV